MGMNIFQKICNSHNLDRRQAELPIVPDQVLTHDGTATPVFLQLEAIGIKKIKPFTVIYVDHNTLQVGYRNADDHRYLKAAAGKLGAIFSRPGNGICHQVHLENFARPGQILVGSDSHTPMAGAVGMLGIGSGGLDVATVMAGEPFFVKMPKVVGVKLEGRLPPWSAGKDVSLYLLGMLSVKGGAGRIFEFFGPGVETLSVPDRATICNMSAEMGATSCIFPSDRVTEKFLTSFGRQNDWRTVAADVDAAYDQIIVVDLCGIEPLIAMPHSPDNVTKVSDAEGVPLSQIGIGSCTNAAYKDLAVAAHILDGKTVHRDLDLVISPGSRRTAMKITETGLLQKLMGAGARILENTCGPCNGVGQSPASSGNSLRTYNRNYKGRAGTLDANVYLASPETAAASALFGCITDPRKLGQYPAIQMPVSFPENSGMFIPPADDPAAVKIVKGPNIKPMPLGRPLEMRLECPVKLKTDDDVTTDHILPGGAEMLSLRSNVPASVPFVFNRLDPDFAKRVDTLPDQWTVVAGDNFGQGSSREHAVMVPLVIGMKLVIAKSFARTYRQNLINFGVVPLVFINPQDYNGIEKDDLLVIEDAPDQITSGRVSVINKFKEHTIETIGNFSDRELKLILQGGLLNYIRLKNIRG
ncbi:MAG: aconitate hydratase [Thermodesulfobacteriota bacterium]